MKMTKFTGYYWIYVNGPGHCNARGPTLGKWLIFKYISCIDQVWETISQTVVSGELGATPTKVSTMKVNPNSSYPNIKWYVYIVQQNKLIHYLCETIRYKTDADTRAWKNACHGDL